MKTLKIFYGYWVLLASFLLFVTSSGCGPISFSFFVTSLETAFNWSRTEIMTGFTVYFICTAISSPVFGRLVHRYGARKIISLGAFSPCIGFILLSQMNALWQFYIGYIFIGFGFAIAGPVVTTLIVSNWFIRRRGAAIGALSMSSGISGMIFTPLVIVYLLPNLGWSNTYLTFAVITGGFIIPLGALVIRTKPADIGLLPDGRNASKIEGIDETLATKGLSLKSAVGTPAYWLMAVATLFQSSNMGVLQNQIPHLEDLGFAAGIVASAMSIVSISSAIGTLFFGWLCDMIRIKIVAILAITLMIFGMILLINIIITSPAWLIWMYATLLGLGVGGTMPCISLFTSNNFGLLSYGTIFGTLNAFMMVGGGGTPIFYGYLFDRTGTYEWAFIFTTVFIALAIPVIMAIRRPKFYSTQSA